jgi:hypothetical protein
MQHRSSMVLCTFAALLFAAGAVAQAQQESAYPDWRGQWTRTFSGGQWDETRPPARGQQAPLIPEYQAEFEAAQADLRNGGRGNTPSMTCIPPGLPRALIVYEAMEIVIKPYATYMLFEFMDPIRRIYTDGRAWPEHFEPTYLGYSIGHWEDTDHDGKPDTLMVETRGFKGPRIVDGSGIPLHKDNQTVIKERIYGDKNDPDILKNEVTIEDHAFTRPWTVTRGYHRKLDASWYEYNCTEDNQHVFIGKDPYLLGADGLLMPARKDQPPPDLRHFAPTPK